MDYVQLLMISLAIQATKVDKNVKKAPKLSKNEMLIFGLHSTSDDRLSNLGDKIRLKCEKMKTFKNKMTFWFWEILFHVDHFVL